MENWMKLSFILGVIGFLKETRPSEQFVFEYLTGNWTNLTDQEVNEDIFTVGTYTNTPLVVIVFLVTDYFRYKPLIVLGGIFGVLTWSMLIWTPTLRMMQLMEIFYGLFSSCDIAYFTYIYAKVDKEQYSKVTANTRIAYLLGKVTSGISSQLLITYDILDYKQLNYITLAAMVLGTIISFFLPPVENSIYFHQTKNNLDNESSKGNSKGAFGLMGIFFKDAYFHDMVLRWSIINAASTCGFSLAENYDQSLWKEVNKIDKKSLQNGYALTAYTFVGIIVSVIAGYWKINWSKYINAICVEYFSISALFIILMSQTNSLYVAYASYALLGGVYEFMTVVSYSEICRRIYPDSYGLILGFNSFISLGLQSIIISIVLKLLHSPVRVEYLLFGSTHIGMLGCYFILDILLRKLHGDGEDSVLEDSSLDNHIS